MREEAPDTPKDDQVMHILFLAEMFTPPRHDDQLARSGASPDGDTEATVPLSPPQGPVDASEPAEVFL